jgi:uncharacterized protein YndB with AHSA1/START domain
LSALACESMTTKITLERTCSASLEEVWKLWTTKKGIESWWGPDGFAVTVQKLELAAGGALNYTMNAVGAPQVAFMKQAGMSLSTPCHVTFTEVSPPRRLVFTTLVDFAPGTPPYDVETAVELRADGGTVHVELSLGAMHDEGWTGQMVQGWEEALDHLRTQAPR